MTWFVKPEGLAAQIAAATKQEKQLADAQAKLLALEPQWAALQTEAELIEARRDAQNGSYASAVSDVLWRERSAKLKQELEAVIDRRDALTAALCADIARLKKSVDRRNGLLVSVFANWIAQVPGDAAVRGELQKLLAGARGMTSAESIVEKIRGAVALVKNDDSRRHLPLFNFRSLSTAFE